MEMATKILIINPGSTSKKYALYVDEHEVFTAHFEKEAEQYIVSCMSGQEKAHEVITSETYANPYTFLIKTLQSLDHLKIVDDIHAVGIRIVAAGSYFLKNQFITREYIAHLKSSQKIVPLHISHIIEEIRELHQTWPQIPVIGISDSTFHATKPEAANTYAIPQSIAKKYDIYRYGYHGISVQSILRKIKHTLGSIPERVIVCHLGGGASITAVKNGQSIDNSMGFTPLEGLYMATRAGDIDASAVLYLQQQLDLSPTKLEAYLNHECGLLGISESSDDIRELIKLRKNKNPQAKLSLETYIYKIKKYIGSYIAALNGVDMIIFSGTVGERSHIIRDEICKNMNSLGILLDEETNINTTTRDGFIHHPGSTVKLVVITTEELKEIAIQTHQFLKSQLSKQS
jgi:acetate kinase